MKTRQEIKAIAKESMGKQRGTAILLGVLLGVVSFASSILDMIVMFATGGQGVLYWIVFTLGMFVIYVAMINMYGEYIKVYKQETADAGAVFTGMGVNFLRKLGGMLWMLLFVFLWSLLFIIPGIIKGLSYFATTFILADCPNVEACDALKVSMKITEGHKADIFVFNLSFIGWYILSIFTCGILYIVYVGPYYSTAASGYYLEMRDEALAQGRITREDLGWGAEDNTAEFAN